MNVFTPKATPAGPLPVNGHSSIPGGAIHLAGLELDLRRRGSRRQGPVVVVSIETTASALPFLAATAARRGPPAVPPPGSDGIRDQQLALKVGARQRRHVPRRPGERDGLRRIRRVDERVHPRRCRRASQPYAKRYIHGERQLHQHAPAPAQHPGPVLPARRTARGHLLEGADGAETRAGGFDPTSPGVLTCLQNASASALMTWVPTGRCSISSPQGRETPRKPARPPSRPRSRKGGRAPRARPSTPGHDSGQYNKDAQLLIGTNENEFGLFVDLATSPLVGGTPASPLNITSAAQLGQGIETVFGAQAAAVEAQYPLTDATAPRVFIDLLTDYVFRCPSSRPALH